MDPLTTKERSRLMASVKSKGTKPELIVRRLAHRLGYRFRLHRHDLPGTPDLVFPKRKAVIFVSGCFWHRHDCSNGRRLPKKNREWWRVKLEGNKARDEFNHARLRELGWRILVIWECELGCLDAVEAKLQAFLD